MNALKKILSRKTDKQLMYYIMYPEKHTEEAVQVALEELRLRKVELPQDIDQLLEKKTAEIRAKANPLTEKEKSAIYNQSLIFSLLYVGLGTLTVFSLSPESWFYGDWVFMSMLITLPVNIISFAMAYGDGDAMVSILIVQIIVFFVCWLIVYLILSSILKWQKS
jgi:hypothetical protein